MKYLEFKTPATDEAMELASDFRLKDQGLTDLERVFWNLPDSALYEEIIFRNEGKIANGGPVLVNTGKHTARAATDKFVVREDTNEDKIWWGEYNRPISPEKFNSIYARVQAYCQDEELFVQDVYAGADPEYRMPVRIITEKAWHSLFARNMLITTPDRETLKNFVPEFTVITVDGFKVDPKIDGTRSSTGIVISFPDRMAIIANSLYGGEIKKSVFTVLNYLLTFKDVLPMHCSANVNRDDPADVAIFFGLSGTGKTTLSADPNRLLIGDDEHGWSDRGVFNFEGGCYAKVIHLSKEAEPEIYECTRRFGTILENVAIDPTLRRIDLNDSRLTENTRASYPLTHLQNIVPSKMAGHPRNIIMLTADAFGVLPPIARLTPEQAMYHFISGYTAKLAGTEKGVTEPVAAFSACFGAPFMVRHPSVYAQLLADKIAKHHAACWLVNTGWTGGPYGIGARMKIQHTRALLNAALKGELEDVEMRRDPLFSFMVPTRAPSVPAEILNPRDTWSDTAAYDAQANRLVRLFQDNFAQFQDQTHGAVVEAGPRAG